MQGNVWCSNHGNWHNITQCHTTTMPGLRASSLSCFCWDRPPTITATCTDNHQLGDTTLLSAAARRQPGGLRTESQAKGNQMLGSKCPGLIREDRHLDASECGHCVDVVFDLNSQLTSWRNNLNRSNTSEY